jgi:plastocyanin
LRVVWIQYRGAGAVTFDPPQFSAWEDTRDGANSPWAAGWRPPAIPPENKWQVRATFKTPGEYVLQCIAHDGALTAMENVTVIVTP